jgi:hypothetical protein
LSLPGPSKEEKKKKAIRIRNHTQKEWWHINLTVFEEVLYGPGSAAVLHRAVLKQ